MQSYLPDKVYVVCTNQLGTGYRQLTIDGDLRPKPNQTVQLGSQERVFLVKLDKKLTQDFTCKSGCSSGAGTMAFGAGVATGLLVAAAVATVPVAGWIVGGAIAIGCLAYGAWQMMQSPTCSQMIGYEESKWVLHHTNVRLDSQHVSLKDKHLALTKRSMLICKEPGGVLLPFISEAMAADAAEKIGNNNQTELGWGVAAGFISGFMLGSGFGWGVLGSYVVWMGIGHYLINPVAEGFGDWTGDVLGNETYRDIKSASVEGNESFDDLSTINPNDEYNLPEDATDVRNLSQIRDMMIKNGASKKDIGQINEAIKAAESNGGKMGAKDNPAARDVLNKIKAGEYGQEAKEIFTNRSGNMRGMNTAKNHGKVIESKKNNIQANNARSIKTGAKTIGGAIQILQPFIGAFYAERAIRLAAEVFDQDAASSISVNANQ